MPSASMCQYSQIKEADGRIHIQAFIYKARMERWGSGLVVVVKIVKKI